MGGKKRVAPVRRRSERKDREDMYNPYGLHSWSKLHHEETLREVQLRRLAKRIEWERGLDTISCTPPAAPTGTP